MPGASKKESNDAFKNVGVAHVRLLKPSGSFRVRIQPRIRDGGPSHPPVRAGLIPIDANPLGFPPFLRFSRKMSPERPQTEARYSMAEEREQNRIGLARIQVSGPPGLLAPCPAPGYSFAG